MQLLPFHCTILAGSVKKAKTVSGRALILTSLTTASPLLATNVLPPLLHFGRSGQAFETAGPELIEKITQLGQTFGPGLVKPAGALAAFIHQPRRLEDLEVLRDRWPGDVEVGGDFPGRQLTVSN
jgi:hypothetical protein